MGDNADRFRYIMHSSDSLYSKMATQPMFKETPIDTELEHKAKKVSDKFSENLNIVANEPSLAFYRIQEHVRKTLPQLVDQKHEVEEVHAQVQGACFDAEYATNALKSMQSSAIHFENIQDLLKNAMFMKQQITYEENRRKQGRPSPSVSPKPGTSVSPKPGTSVSPKPGTSVEGDRTPTSGALRPDGGHSHSAERRPEQTRQPSNEKPALQLNASSVGTETSDECLEVERIMSPDRLVP